MRNAEVLQVLGMTDNLLARWRKLQNEIAGIQTSASRLAASPSPPSRDFLRQAIQIGMLALGAYLGAHAECLRGHHDRHDGLARPRGATRGTIGRRVGACLTEARAAYRRLRISQKNFPTTMQPPVTLPCPEG